MSNLNWVCNKRSTETTLAIATFLDTVTVLYHNASGKIFIF